MIRLTTRSVRFLGGDGHYSHATRDKFKYPGIEAEDPPGVAVQFQEEYKESPNPTAGSSVPDIPGLPPAPFVFDPKKPIDDHEYIPPYTYPPRELLSLKREGVPEYDKTKLRTWAGLPDIPVKYKTIDQVRAEHEYLAGNYAYAFGISPEAGLLGKSQLQETVGITPIVGTFVLYLFSKEFLIFNEEMIHLGIFAIAVSGFFFKFGQSIHESLLERTHAKHRYEFVFPRLYFGRDPILNLCVSSCLGKSGIASIAKLRS